MAEFRTRFINKSADWRRIPECVVVRNGMKIFVPDIPPGDTFTLVGDDPFAIYSPYSKIVFHEDRIEATLRRGWVNINPFRGRERVTEFLLEKTSRGSYALFPEPGEPSIVLIPGIKRWLQVSLFSPYVEFSRVYVRQIKVKGLEQFKFIEIKEKRLKREIEKIRKAKEEILSKHGSKAVYAQYAELGF